MSGIASGIVRIISGVGEIVGWVGKMFSGVVKIASGVGGIVRYVSEMFSCEGVIVSWVVGKVSGVRKMASGVVEITGASIERSVTGSAQITVSIRQINGSISKQTGSEPWFSLSLHDNVVNMTAADARLQRVSLLLVVYSLAFM